MKRLESAQFQGTNIAADRKSTKMVSVQWTVDQFLAAEMGFTSDVARSLVDLFEDGCEVPFIARYRRHLIGGLTPDDLRHALHTIKCAKTVKAKAEKLLKQADAEIEDRALKGSVKDALSRTMDADQLDSLFEPFKKAKKTSLASRAAELGAAEICRRLCRGEFVDLQRFVGSRPELNTRAKVEEVTVHLLSHELHCLEETQTFLQAVAKPNNDLNIHLKVKSTLTKNAKSLKETDKDFSLIEHFKLYTSFAKDVRFVQPFQILALERASSKDIVNWKVCVDDRITSFHPGLKLAFHPSHIDLLRKSVRDSTKRFLIPSIERRVRRILLDRAENSAIDCFAKNLRQLLLTAPLKCYAVLAIDPGYSNGCKCALTNDNGVLIGTAVFHFVCLGTKHWEPDEHAEKILKTLASKASGLRLVVAVGNGTGSRETQRFVASLIQRHVIVAQFCVISECGASVYSATKLAAEELPDVDINLRSAVSLARRVIDPISEYVKIAPKHLGVGLYQHSINEKRLDDMLDIVVRECVSNVGVDVNVASQQVLQKVSGLNKRTAANLIKYRQENGPIRSREELKEISGIGKKCFEQCAGFLYIYGSERLDEPVRKKAKLARNFNPLDTTPVHPENYETAKQILELAGVDLAHIGQSGLSQKLAVLKEQIVKRGPEWVLVWELLSNPFVRKNAPVLLKDIRDMRALKEGDVVEGVVRNHAQFGIFIDIGVGFDALAHVSTLSSVIPEVNTVVKVRIRRLEMNRQRIGVVLV